MKKFMMYHPLRETLKVDDWQRVQKSLDNAMSEQFATEDELDAAADVFYDAIANKTQTHFGVTTLQ